MMTPHKRLMCKFASSKKARALRNYTQWCNWVIGSLNAEKTQVGVIPIKSYCRSVMVVVRREYFSHIHMYDVSLDLDENAIALYDNLKSFAT